MFINLMKRSKTRLETNNKRSTQIKRFTYLQQCGNVCSLQQNMEASVWWEEEKTKHPQRSSCCSSKVVSNICFYVTALFSNLFASVLLDSLQQVFWNFVYLSLVYYCVMLSQNLCSRIEISSLFVTQIQVSKHMA